MELSLGIVLNLYRGNLIDLILLIVAQPFKLLTKIKVLTDKWAKKVLPTATPFLKYL